MRFLFFILTLLPVLAFANPTHWRQFELKIISQKDFDPKKIDGNVHTKCTGTLLKIEDQCRFITNAHCLNKDDDLVIAQTGITGLFPEYQYDISYMDQGAKSHYDLFMESAPFMTVTMAKKRFITKDLVELMVTPDLRKNYCEGLLPVDLNVLKSVETKKKSYAAIGYFMDVATVAFLGDRAWNISKERGVLVPYQSSLNLKSFYRVQGLTTFKGMSGGLLINEDMLPIGIVTRHVPFQEESFVIGLQEVVQFVSEAKEPLTSSPEVYFPGNKLIFHSNKDGSVGENDHGNGGENDHGNGGENDHGNGGENDHGNGGSTGPSKKPKIKNFNEAQEGVVDPANPSQILLNKCGEQIDGYEDYVRTKTCQGPSITRPLKGYPSREVSTNILKRLLGNFGGKLLRGRGHKIYYVEVENFLEGWRKLAKGQFEVRANANPDGIYFEFKSKGLFRLLDKYKASDSENLFQVSLFPSSSGTSVEGMVQYARESGTANTTSYMPRAERITCDNKNYLKLICASPNDQFVFSLSKSRADAKDISFRIAHRTGLNIQENAHEVVTYYYGEMGIDETGKLSDLPISGSLIPGL